MSQKTIPQYNKTKLIPNTVIEGLVFGQKLSTKLPCNGKCDKINATKVDKKDQIVTKVFN